MQLDHLNICAPATLLEEVCAFYCDILSFTTGPRPEFGVPGYWLYAPGSDVAAVHLLVSDTHQRSDNSYLDHIAFRVETLAPVRSALEQRNIYYMHREFADFKIEQIHFLDPAGLKLELTAPIA